MSSLKKQANHLLSTASGSGGNGQLFLVVGAVCVTLLGVLGQFLFGEKLLLFTDIGNDTFYNYYANYYMFTNYISNFELPLWSFKLGAGASVLTLYQFLYDPFSILYYLGGVENISRVIAWVFALKTLCAAVFTYLYLRCIGIGVHARTVVSVLFAFNGFLMVFGQHFFYGSWAIFLPLFLYFLERWFRENRWLPLALCTSFMALNIAIFWQIAIFSAIYVAIKVGIEWRERSMRDWGEKLVKTGGILALGVGISAVLWLPEYYVLDSSPRISTSFSAAFFDTLSGFFRLYPPEYYPTLLARIFSNNLQGIGSEYAGFSNYYTIGLCAGALPLMLLPQAYCVLSARGKWAASLAILAAAAFLVTPGFSQLMNGFQYPHQRWGYNIIMFELLLAAVVLDQMIKQRKICLPTLLATGLFLFAGMALVKFNGSHLDFTIQKYSDTRTIEIGAFVFLYGLMLYWLVMGKSKQLAFSILLTMVCGELILEHRDSFVRRNVLTKGIETNRAVNFFDYGHEAVKYLNARDPSFYRVEKNLWILSLDDALVQNYYGLDSYQSLNNPSYIDFLKAIGYSFPSLNVLSWNSLEHPYLADVLSVKYHLTKDNNLLPPGARFIQRFGDVSIYSRAGYLPFGFTYDAYIPLSAFSLLSVADRERALLQGGVLDQPPPIELKKITQVAPVSEDERFRSERRKDVLSSVDMGEDLISGNIRLEQSKLLFLSIPFDRGWTAYVNGKNRALHRVNLGFSGLYLNPGKSRIVLRYIPPYIKMGAAISLVSLFLVLLASVLSRKRNSMAVQRIRGAP